MANDDQTIIIKKIKKGGHGHHGGAWKVAYADFVTAMMAFFLLMWLLNATEAESLSGLADYFAPTVGVIGNMGIGFRGGKGALSKGIGADKNTNKGIIFGGVQTGPVLKVTQKLDIETQEPEQERIIVKVGDDGVKGKVAEPEDDITEEPQDSFSEVADTVESYVNEMVAEDGMEEAVDITETPDGLVIQIKSTQDESMFQAGTAILQPEITQALRKLADIIGQMPHQVDIIGHTSAVPFRNKYYYSNWELSAARANAVRRVLIDAGMPGEQIASVVGKSDNDPLDPASPASIINNRLSIVLLKQAHIARHKKGAPESIFIETDSEYAKELLETPENASTETEEGTQTEYGPANSELQDAMEQIQTQADEEEVIDETVKGWQDGLPSVDNLFDGEGAPIAPRNLLLDLPGENDKENQPKTIDLEKLQ